MISFPRLHTADRFQAAEAQLRRAAEAVAHDPGLYGRRVEFVQRDVLGAGDLSIRMK